MVIHQPFSIALCSLGNLGINQLKGLERASIKVIPPTYFSVLLEYLYCELIYHIDLHKLPLVFGLMSAQAVNSFRLQGLGGSLVAAPGPVFPLTHSLLMVWPQPAQCFLPPTNVVGSCRSPHTGHFNFMTLMATS
ncbi:hypothetical protein AERO8C_160175 [Aeromonas veronii]|uniref:Uncharacterized protein n=1 Tax=Aeromonas veronii TaxID=654 RepID=A0A653KY70_AERVE|nr:hypothetical protein AERO8C_160175 [Aeromonas veronii]